MAYVYTPPTPSELEATFAEMRLRLQEKQRARAEGREDPWDVFCEDYQRYLLSKLWATIKRRVLKRDNKTCRSCGGPGSTVHHWSYDEDVIRGKNNDKLATVCDGCHHNIHFREDGTKRPETEWEAAMLAPRTRRDFPEPIVEWKRKQAIATYPAEWDGMNALQRAGWEARRRELAMGLHMVAAQRRGKRLARELAKQGPRRGFFSAPPNMRWIE